jgi:shikimate dehydrogenase
MSRVGLLGYPLSHSVSPAMHNAAFTALNLPGRYELLETPAEELPAVVARLRQDEWMGANVTIPHKARVIELLDEIDPSAAGIGAVNTIVRNDERLIGHNTDVTGFQVDLRSHGVEIKGDSVIILGSGGAARAVTAALIPTGAQIRYITPLIDEAGQLIDDLVKPAGAQAEILPWEDDSFAAADSRLVVNATPVGMSPDVGACPWPDDIPLPKSAFVYDLVYNPAETMLMQRARTEGLGAGSGLGMLVEQGALAFELWTGLTPSREIMTAAAQTALEGRDA